MFAKERSGAPDDDVQRFIAFGQLCHLIVTTALDDETGEWARIVSAGIRHPDIDATASPAVVLTAE